MKTNKICQTLRERICFLDYPPGTRLGEVELAEEFGVSRTPIRSALAELEAEGLVRARRGVCTVVTEIDQETLLQTLQLRKELALLIVNMSPSDDLEMIERDVSRLLAHCESRRESISITDFARLNSEFFELMVRLTQNRPMREVSRKLYYLTARLWVNAIPQLSFEDEIAHFILEMKEVISALERKDLAAVGHIRWLHLSNCIDRHNRQRNKTTALRPAS